MEPDPGPIREALRRHPDEGLPTPALPSPERRGELVLEQVRPLDTGKRGEDLGR
ncbi:hypothetical protein LINPERPRIM_LOCUS26216 [Linum perenne]